MIKKSLNTVKIITCGLLLSTAHCNNLNNQVEQLTEVEKILNMDVSFNTLNKNILDNNDNITKHKNIEKFYHYLMGNDGFNLCLILSYGTPNVLSIVKDTIDNKNNPVVGNYIKSNGIETKIIGTINGIQSQFIETDMYGTFNNTPSSKQQFKDIYSKAVNNTFPNYFTENNNFNKAIKGFGRNMYGCDNEAHNIIISMSDYFKERENTINKQKTLSLNNWEDVFNRTMKYKEEQKNKK